MLYDEEGLAYVEPPLLPAEQHIHNIVKDYRHMYSRYTHLENRNNKYKASLRRMVALQYAYSRIIFQQNTNINKLIKMLRNDGYTIPADIETYQEQVKKMMKRNKAK